MILRNFRTYQVAKEFYKECEALRLPHHIKYQLSRASLSIVNNLAEGSARHTIKDRAHFYRIALASYRESCAMLEVSNNLNTLRKYDCLGAYLFNLHKFTLKSSNSP